MEIDQLHPCHFPITSFISFVLRFLPAHSLLYSVLLLFFYYYSLCRKARYGIAS